MGFLPGVFSRDQPGLIGAVENDGRFKRPSPVRSNATIDTSYPVCTMTPDDALWIQLDHFFRQNISSKKAILLSLL